MNDSTLMHKQGRRQFMQAGAGLAMTVTLGAGSNALAQSDTPIKIAVGFPPGGSGDLFARIFADNLREELSRPVLVENTPGAGGLTVAIGFFRAPRDGTQLMMSTGSTSVPPFRRRG